jgi:integrase
LHDLRRGFASAGVAAGESLFIIGKLLGHKQSRTTERDSSRQKSCSSSLL